MALRRAWAGCAPIQRPPMKLWRRVVIVWESGLMVKETVHWTALTDRLVMNYCACLILPFCHALCGWHRVNAQE
jgi:hypothetical protein